MKIAIKRNTIVEIISSLFILLFVYTAISKLANIDRFQNVLHNAPKIGKYAHVISWLLPITEIVVALLLFFPKTKKIGLYSSLLLMVAFTGYLFYMIFFAYNLPCSCGGVLEKMSWNQHLIFNCFFTLLAGIGIWLNKRKPSQPEILSSSKAVYT